MDFTCEQLITRDDIIRGGACGDEVRAWAERHAPNKTAMPLQVALRMASESETSYIQRAVWPNIDGGGGGGDYGDGGGYGYGDGGGGGGGDYGDGGGGGGGDYGGDYGDGGGGDYGDGGGYG